MGARERVREYPAYRAAEAARGSEGPARQDRAPRPGGTMPYLLAAARGGASRRARCAEQSARSDRDGWDLLQAAHRAAGDSPGGCHAGGGDARREEARQASEREGTLREQARERARLQKERAGLVKRMQEIERRVAARDVGYNAERHNAVRQELTRLEPVALAAAALAARADRAEALVGEAEIAEKALSTREEHVKQLAEAVKAQGFSEPKFQAARERHDRAAHALRAAELAVAETRGELVAAETAVREIERRVTERAARERTIAERKIELRVHNELDRAFSDLRAELNAAMRPEIGALASGFLSDLTDARYDEVDLDEDYRVVVLDEGVPKPVISGGEEDIANLVLRLAISQMIAERAGQPLSLLVLDEIFGSLDESRRQHVLALLRRLATAFRRSFSSRTSSKC